MVLIFPTNPNVLKPPLRVGVMDMSMRDKILLWSAVLLSILVFTSVWIAHPPNAAQKEAMKTASSGGISPDIGGAAGTGTVLAANRTVSSANNSIQVDYLYADWCPHCRATRPALMSAVNRLGSAVSLNEWNEALRGSDAQVAAIYNQYKSEGVFIGFPTLVAHGPKGESSIAGEQTESELMTWMCAQYVDVPAACKQ